MKTTWAQGAPTYLAAGDLQNENQAGPIYFLPPNYEDQSPPIHERAADSRRPGRPSIQFTQLLQSLVRHPHRTDYLLTITARLKLTDEGWDVVQKTLQQEESLAILPVDAAQFQQLPEEMVAHAERMKAHPEWEKHKDWALRSISTGTISRPSSTRVSSQARSQRSSGLSMSTLSTCSTFGSNTMRDSVSSTASTYGDLADILHPSISTPIVEESSGEPPPPPVPEKDTKPYKCPIVQCGMEFKGGQTMKNHVMTKHPWHHSQGVPTRLLARREPICHTGQSNMTFASTHTKGSGQRHIAQAVKQSVFQSYMPQQYPALIPTTSHVDEQLDQVMSDSDLSWSQHLPAYPTTIQTQAHSPACRTPDTTDPNSVENDQNLSGFNAQFWPVVSDDLDTYNAGFHADEMFRNYVRRQL